MAIIEIENATKGKSAWLGAWSDYYVVAVGDIDGDSDFDIIQQEDTNNMGVIELGETVRVIEVENATKNGSVRNVDTFADHIVFAASDIDGDNDVDILMQESSGTGKDIIFLQIEREYKEGDTLVIGIHDDTPRVFQIYLAIDESRGVLSCPDFLSLYNLLK